MTNDREKRPTVFLALIGVLLISFVVFLPSLQNGFLNWDDPEHLLDNPMVRSLSIPHLKTIFTRTTQTVYIPLTVLSWALEYHFFGFHPLVYHLDNLLLHLAVTGLVFGFARQVGLTPRAAFFAALLFGIHPMRVESVVWVTERKDVLCGLFYLLALRFYWRYLEQRRTAPYLLSLLFGGLGMLAKPMAVSLPLALGLCDWLKGRRWGRRIVLEKLPYLVVIVPLAWLTYRVHARVPGHDLIEGMLIWSWTGTFYLKQFLFPAILIPLYQLPRPVALFSLAYLTAFGLLALVAFALVRFRKEKRLTFAILFYLVTIVFLLRVDATVDKCVVADRFMYLPSLGLCLFLGEMIHKYLKKTRGWRQGTRTLANCCLAALFLALAVKTAWQTQVWQNDLVFWDYVVRHAPGPVAYNYRGMVYAGRKEYGRAIKDYTEAIAVKPDYVEPYINRGNIFEKTGRYDAALADYNRTLAIRPGTSKAYGNRGVLYFHNKQYALALADYNTAIRLEPDEAEHYNNRGSVFEAQGRYDAALSDYNTAIAKDPYGAKAYNNRGVLFARQGENVSALADFTRAIENDPRDATAHYNRYLLHLNRKDYPRALSDARRAKALGHPRIDESVIDGLKKKFLP